MLLIWHYTFPLQGKPYIHSSRKDLEINTWNFNVSHHGKFVSIVSHPHLLVSCVLRSVLLQISKRIVLDAKVAAVHFRICVYFHAMQLTASFLSLSLSSHLTNLCLSTFTLTHLPPDGRGHSGPGHAAQHRSQTRHGVRLHVR